MRYRYFLVAEDLLEGLGNGQLLGNGLAVLFGDRGQIDRHTRVGFHDGLSFGLATIGDEPAGGFLHEEVGKHQRDVADDALVEEPAPGFRPHGDDFHGDEADEGDGDMADAHDDA